MAQTSPFELSVPVEDYRTAMGFWLRVLSKSERKNFDAVVGFRCLFGWTGIRVDWDMLRAVSRFWSSTSHLFHFSYNEMCPTVEEFCAMTGSSEGRTIAVPSFTRPPVSALQELLGLSVQECRGMIRGAGGQNRFVDLTSLPFQFADPVSGPLAVRRRQNALALCLFAKYFFVSYEGLVDARVPDIVLQAMDGVFNIVPVILAETLHGLDNFANGAVSFSSGAPILIHMWTQEHFNQIPSPREGPYEPSAYSTRGRCANSPVGETEWISFFSQVLSCEINWTVPHWRIRRLVAHSCGYAVVLLPGLYSSSFYWASRVLRQFGWEQVVPSREEPVAPVESLEGPMVRHIQNIWQHSARDRTIAAPDSPMSVLLSLEYIEWIAHRSEDHGVDVAAMVEQTTGLSLSNGIHSRLWEIGLNPEETQLNRQKPKARRDGGGSSRPRSKNGGNGDKRPDKGDGSSKRKGGVFSRLGF